MKALSHFVNQYHQLPEELLLKWTVIVTNLGGVYLVFEFYREEEHVWVDTQPTANYAIIRWLYMIQIHSSVVD